MFPFLIGKVLTVGDTKSDISSDEFLSMMFPFLIGKVLTEEETVAFSIECIIPFQFLIGKVLTGLMNCLL